MCISAASHHASSYTACCNHTITARCDLDDALWTTKSGPCKFYAANYLLRAIVWSTNQLQMFQMSDLMPQSWTDVLLLVTMLIPGAIWWVGIIFTDPFINARFLWHACQKQTSLLAQSALQSTSFVYVLCHHTGCWLVLAAGKCSARAKTTVQMHSR